jgi:hypothetical protein
VAEIEFSAKDYPGFTSASLDLCVPGRPGKPSGLFDRRVEVYLGAEHINLTHYEWGIELHGGPKLKAAYLLERPSFGFEPLKGIKEPMKLVRFVEREIRRHAASSSKAFQRLLAAQRKAGQEEGREEARAEIRSVLGVGSRGY